MDARLVLDYAFVSMGFIAVTMAMFASKFYYSDEYGNGSKPAPTWLGKMTFSVIGTIFIVFGFLDLFGVIQLDGN